MRRGIRSAAASAFRRLLGTTLEAAAERVAGDMDFARERRAQAMGAFLLNAFGEELTKLEGRVDDLHDIGLKELFLKHRTANTMDYIVGAEIYDHLEKVADRFDDVANEISNIVIEQV